MVESVGVGVIAIVSVDMKVFSQHIVFQQPAQPSFLNKGIPFCLRLSSSDMRPDQENGVCRLWDG